MPAAVAFDPRFVERSPLFWPIAPTARVLLGPFAGATEFPPVESFDRVFAGTPAAQTAQTAQTVREPPVRFVLAAPSPRRRGRRRQPVDPRSLYDGRITLERVVPTRVGSWHDLMNALVWGTFPRAKSALHARQYRAIAERIAPGARTLPPSRTRELDALALLDEGGVILTTHAPDSAVVFGHAIYESLARGIPPAVVAAFELNLGPNGGLTRPEGPIDSNGPGGANGPADARELAGVLAAVDEGLARTVEDTTRLRTPEELRRVELRTRTR